MMKWWTFLQFSTLKIVGLSFIFSTEYATLGWFIFLLGGGVVLFHLFLPRAQGLCDVVTTFNPNGKEVWLTIDDGPDPVDTPAILKALADHGAKATFFMIGDRAAEHPELVDQVLAAGHSIGAHTQTHPELTYWAAGRKRVERELDESLVVLNRKGYEISLYRSPVGIKNLFLRRALKVRHLKCIGWSIRSGDGLGRSVSQILHRVEKELRPGAIILLHEGGTVHPDVRIKLIGEVLWMLSANGYRCVLPDPLSHVF